ncbi:hypothetical protein B0H14DRAFT_3901692, partial [Mycena olivaceomarginata]
APPRFLLLSPETVEREETPGNERVPSCLLGSVLHPRLSPLITTTPAASSTEPPPHPFLDSVRAAAPGHHHSRSPALDLHSRRTIHGTASSGSTPPAPSGAAPATAPAPAASDATRGRAEETHVRPRHQQLPEYDHDSSAPTTERPRARTRARAPGPVLPQPPNSDIPPDTLRLYARVHTWPHTAGAPTRIRDRDPPNHRHGHDYERARASRTTLPSPHLVLRSRSAS